jgi:tetratricopeptide (TPR) repeat protein
VRTRGINPLALLLVVAVFSGCSRQSSSVATSKPATADTLSDDEAMPAANIIPELEARVAQNPNDFVAFNKLAGYYLQRQRETGEDKWIMLAGRAAKSSLAIIPAERNIGGLAALAQVQLASHEFATARDYAEQLIKLEPTKAYPQLILVDALVELGQYQRAEEIFEKIKKESVPSVGTETRLSKFAQLKGQSAAAKQHMANALALSLQQVPKSREPIAWCQWQLGELEFSTGDYGQAEHHYKAALETFPDYFRALAGMARVKAALGTLPEAITYAERTVQVIAEPLLVSLLGDLYKLAGRDQDATKQYELAEKIALQEAAEGRLHKRELAVFYADHDLKASDAFNLALDDYSKRPDIFGADTLAWAALKANKLDEAKKGIKDALRLGTKDAKIFYHAGMIMRAVGEEAAAKDFLKRALETNPHFDPLQSRVLRQQGAS